MKLFTKLMSLTFVLAILLTGCSGDSSDTEGGVKEITIWRGDGTEEEEAFYEQQISDYNASQDEYKVVSEVFPYGEIGTTTRAAAATDSLPDMVFFDGTEVSNAAFSQFIVPIGDDIDQSVYDNFSDSAFSYYDDDVYGVSQQEGGLALWANESYLEEAGVRIPTYEEPWTSEEFVGVLEDLKSLDAIDYPLELRIGDGPGYVSYAWQPFVVSNGGDWYNHDDNTATGALNSDEVIEVMNYMNNLASEDLINSKESSVTTFPDKTSALELSGHWNYSTYKDALGEDLTLVPIPDFGNGSQTGVGGIAFTVTTAAETNDTYQGCVDFINFALGDEYQEQINDVNGSLPANINVLKTIDKFAEGGDLELYAQQIEGQQFAVRPPTPAYPTYQTEVGNAVFDILNGSDPEERLNEAAESIDEVIEANNY